MPDRWHKSAFPPGQIRHSTAPFPLSNAVWSLQNYSRKQNTASRLISFPNCPLAPVTNILFIEIHIIVKPITGIFQAWMVSVLFRKDHLSGRNPPVDSQIRIGDRLYFEDMAIYSMVKTNTFNGIPLPSIAVMDKAGNCRIIKEFGYEDFKNRLS